MKELTDEQLKKASIVDLTDDVDLMRKSLRMEYFEPVDVEAYTPDGRMFTLFSFAEYTKNEALLQRLKKLFEKKLAAIFIE